MSDLDDQPTAHILTFVNRLIGRENRHLCCTRRWLWSGGRGESLPHDGPVSRRRGVHERHRGASPRVYGTIRLEGRICAEYNCFGRLVYYRLSKAWDMETKLTGCQPIASSSFVDHNFYNTNRVLLVFYSFYISKKGRASQNPSLMTSS